MRWFGRKLRCASFAPHSLKVGCHIHDQRSDDERESSKPRVFLSHSKKDIEFIKRLDADLRACQCEIWIDEIEIRHGKPWLDEVFSAGIPSCEIVLCYITSNSVQSVMVRQEIDARLIERMQNEHVTILPYVASEDIRGQLRSDLQSLQIPVLNDATYTQMFPRIVAQVLAFAP